MDRLYKRYADPFSFINGLINTGRFSKFIDFFVEKTNEEQMWEFFLHKVEDGTFEEFKDEVKNNSLNQNMSVETMETTVQESMDILKNFNPQDE